jgi:hypothetical protein
MLDDALIHLRYACVLHDQHRISFDGIHPGYGTSSLLYVGVLALLRSVTHSPFLPKAVSLVAYAGLLALVIRLSRINRLALALLFVLISPFAVRWLTDGMETGLACLLAVAFSMLLFRKASPMALASIALVLSLLRVDLTLLVAFGVIVCIDRRQWLRAASLCAGSGLSLIFIRVTMGHLLPDTALAKEGLGFFVVLATVVYEIAATCSCGFGLLLLWLVSAVAAWRVDRRSALVANLPFPVIVFLAAVKGQQIHSIRYLIWALLFSIVWNLLLTAAVSRPRPVFLAAFACVLALCWTIELPIVLRIDRGHSQNLFAMEHAHLDRLHGEGAVADVGFIGYFSQAPLCDMNGLVNGRAAALMTFDQRSQACMAANPSFLFVSQNQIGYLDANFNIHSQTDWFECGSVDFTNVRSTDRHWLLVRRSDYPLGCPSHL